MTLPAENPADRLVLDAVGAAFSALPPGARVAVAFSGGLDSTSLLDAAVRVAGAARCVALHVHHGLSPHADEWLAHCDAFARERGVTFEARHVDISRESGVSIEAAARDARYRALDEMCVGHDIPAMWLAQHADDQAETVLLQLLRGAGLAGLAAMAPERLAPGARIVRFRPLLHVLRAQLEQYAHARDLSWIDDESNADTRYARNALRHEVLPQLAVHFPGFRDALSRTATHAAAAQRLLDELARIDLQQAARNDARALSRDALLALDDERAINLLRYWIRTLGLPAASTARLADALRQLRDVTRDHGMRVDHAGQSLRNYRDEIYWEAGESAEPADETAIDARPVSELTWRGESIWRLPQWRGTFVFAEVEADDPDAIAEPLLTRAPLAARSRAGGERMRVDANGSSRTLKNLFQERGVPSWKRDVPLVFSGDALLFVPLVGINRETATIAADEPEANASRYFRLDWRPDVLIA
ncbi:tRNA lysidine(34) synthetase TilS [Paraburkholderia saeva]|uniref:tRNA(Ile)-lysidine synthase n=1 Tax=Paraburkholderia saeva TaxID=2777537 RepID=A0A9N8RVY8_9BURK|nr:tRNA lysidine(34) synthetase TilS [Paraburkholderia saeva]CAG4892390.1 tRNA(Ile)-lysidine synthase [Paraburkholderia saeva]CAG4899233.1 tRNA(Ile)-lysidine synthase [Paraburkholderia saeva]CAG4899614.1 tRNA(Ile)-lysidine synthase [Paraburkholderia saeva]